MTTAHRERDEDGGESVGVQATPRLLVTGATGFLGRAVSAAGLTRGYEVFCLLREGERPPSPAAPFKWIGTQWTDVAALTVCLEQVRPSLVVHCAGASARGLPANDRDALYEANVSLVWRLLDAARRSGVDSRIVLISSAAVYGRNPEVPTREDAQLNPASHYGLSKLIAEELAKRFQTLDGLDARIARPFNLLGRGEPVGSVVHRIAEQALTSPSGRSVPIRLRETASRRDFVDVDDAAQALITIGENGKRGEAYNICSGRATSIEELVEVAAAAWCREIRVVTEDPSSRGDISRGSTQRIRALGWIPRISLEESLVRLATDWTDA